MIFIGCDFQLTSILDFTGSLINKGVQWVFILPAKGKKALAMKVSKCIFDAIKQSLWDKLSGGIKL